jgi:hypothetical protein
MNRIKWCLCLAAALMYLCGCDSSGSTEPSEKAERTYTGLEKHKCAVMVWADLHTRADYNHIQLDLARLVQARLQRETTPRNDDKDKAKASPAAEFLNPASVVRFQKEHPEIDGAPIIDVAPRLGVDRVIYIEINYFSAQSAASIMLLKGEATATLRVLEVANRHARIAFEEPDIKVRYPKDAPEGVIPTDKITVQTIYEGTLTALADKIAMRFDEKK